MILGSRILSFFFLSSLLMVSLSSNFHPRGERRGFSVASLFSPLLTPSSWPPVAPLLVAWCMSHFSFSLPFHLHGASLLTLCSLSLPLSPLVVIFTLYRKKLVSPRVKTKRTDQEVLVNQVAVSHLHQPHLHLKWASVIWNKLISMKMMMMKMTMNISFLLECKTSSVSSSKYWEKQKEETNESTIELTKTRRGILIDPVR